MTPTAVARALIDGVCRLVSGDGTRLEQLVALYAEPTLVLHPMSPQPIPPLRSRDELRDHFREGPARAGADRFDAVDVTVHETADPEVVVAEFRYRHQRGAAVHHIPCVFVLRVRDGLIVESHDYADHVAMARAAGRLDRLQAVLSG
ncbi:MAG: nuclear transport factor 2 family protein [Pseudonocardia sp.]